MADQSLAHLLRAAIAGDFVDAQKVEARLREEFASVDRINSLSVATLKDLSGVAERMLALDARIQALEIRTDSLNVPIEVREHGWQWRPAGEDTAFAPPFSTIRECRGCGCLVVGGVTCCNRCVAVEEWAARAVDPRPPTRLGEELPTVDKFGPRRPILECNQCGSFPMRADLLREHHQAGDRCPAGGLDDYDCDGVLQKPDPAIATQPEVAYPVEYGAGPTPVRVDSLPVGAKCLIEAVVMSPRDGDDETWLAAYNPNGGGGFYVPHTQLVLPSKPTAKAESSDDTTFTQALSLLHRVQKYAHEDKAETPGYTRLPRVLAQVRRFLAQFDIRDHECSAPAGAAEAPSAPLQLQVGHRYKREDGELADVLLWYPDGDHAERYKVKKVGAAGAYWTDGHGRTHTSGRYAADLVEYLGPVAKESGTEEVKPRPAWCESGDGKPIPAGWCGDEGKARLKAVPSGASYAVADEDAPPFEGEFGGGDG